MKKHFILLVFFVGGFCSLQAGLGDKKGIRAGLNSSWLAADNYSVNSNLNSAYVGVYMYEKIAPLLKLGTGLDYYQLGNDKPKFAMHYLEMPLNLRLKTGPVLWTAGTGFRLKMWEREEQPDGSMDYPEENSAVWYDIPVRAGVGVKFLIMGLELRYNLGMVDISNGIHNHNLQFGAFVEF